MMIMFVDWLRCLHHCDSGRGNDCRFLDQLIVEIEGGWRRVTQLLLNGGCIGLKDFIS